MLIKIIVNKDLTITISWKTCFILSCPAAVGSSWESLEDGVRGGDAKAGRIEKNSDGTHCEDVEKSETEHKGMQNHWVTKGHGNRNTLKEQDYEGKDHSH